jgi:hypothetical protein
MRLTQRLLCRSFRPVQNHGAIPLISIEDSLPSRQLFAACEVLGDTVSIWD